MNAERAGALVAVRCLRSLARNHGVFPAIPSPSALARHLRWVAAMLRNVDPDRRLACCPTRQPKDPQATPGRLLSVTELWLLRPAAPAKRPTKHRSVRRRSDWSHLD
jgi:hypothetical protein